MAKQNKGSSRSRAAAALAAAAAFLLLAAGLGAGAIAGALPLDAGVALPLFLACVAGCALCAGLAFYTLGSILREQSAPQAHGSEEPAAEDAAGEQKTVPSSEEPAAEAAADKREAAPSSEAPEAAADTRGTALPGEAPARGAGEETGIASSAYTGEEPLAEDAAPAREEDAAAARAESKAQARRKQAEERIETVDRMLSHTHDIFAMARDIAASTSDPETFAGIREMLRGSSALQPSEALQCRPAKLGRTARYWLNMDFEGLSEEQIDCAIGLEAVFNINQDLQRQMAQGNSTDIRENLLAVLEASSSAQPNYRSENDYVDIAYPDVDPEEVVGEWALRNAIASAAENARPPFRINLNMRTNAQRGVALISLEVPRPACFNFIAKGWEEQQAFARDYAFRSALFMAHVALGAAPAKSPVLRAVVACHAQGSSKCLLSLEATPGTVSRLDALAANAAPLSFPPNMHGLRICFENDWLEPVHAHLSETDPILRPDRYRNVVESSTQRCYPRLAKATGALRECDLGIREEAAKEEAWKQLGSLGESTQSAVSKLSALKEASSLPGVQKACERSMHALVSGSAAPGQLEQLKSIFMGSEELAGALAYGMQVYSSGDIQQAQLALEHLKSALSPQLQISMMDDTESVFRYFHNTAERLFFNLESGERRRVNLIPSPYYAANELAAHLLCQLDRVEEALPYANETLRIAPFSSTAALTKSRVLELQSHMFEACSLINDAIQKAATVHDAALCYYRMAYLQWQMGRHDIANACYRMSIGLRSDISLQARKELNELLEEDGSLENLDFSGSCRFLERNEIRVWDLESRQAELGRAAVLCADQTLYPCAAQLAMYLLEFKNDDALSAVFKSMVVL